MRPGIGLQGQQPFDDPLMHLPGQALQVLLRRPFQIDDIRHEEPLLSLLSQILFQRSGGLRPPMFDKGKVQQIFDKFPVLQQFLHHEVLLFLGQPLKSQPEDLCFSFFRNLINILQLFLCLC